MNQQWTSKKSFVTNLSPDEDIDSMLRIASHLNIPAWTGAARGDAKAGDVGFYVHHAVSNLTHYWDIINSTRY